MFDMLGMLGNYQSRKVGRWDNDDGSMMVSTCSVTDGERPYETAFKHPEYNNGLMVIVEAYASREDAEAGHAKWVDVMTNGPLPNELVDCMNSTVSALCGAFGGDEGIRFPRKTTA